MLKIVNHCWIAVLIAPLLQSYPELTSQTVPIVFFKQATLVDQQGLHNQHCSNFWRGSAMLSMLVLARLKWWNLPQLLFFLFHTLTLWSSTAKERTKLYTCSVRRKHSWRRLLKFSTCNQLVIFAQRCNLQTMPWSLPSTSLMICKSRVESVPTCWKIWRLMTYFEA